MRSSSDYNLKPHTLNWTEFANWAIKHLDQSYDIFVDCDGRGKINELEISQGGVKTIIREEGFIAATLVDRGARREVQVEFHKYDYKGEKKYVKKTFREGADHKFPMFGNHKSVLDLTPEPDDDANWGAADDYTPEKDVPMFRAILHDE